MKLTELKPRWVGYGDPATESSIINGVSFLCPHCGKETGQRLAVMFHPAIDKWGWIARGVEIHHGAIEWTRGVGDTFDTLTLSPSINAQAARMDFQNHWHGFIINGEVT